MSRGCWRPSRGAFILSTTRFVRLSQPFLPLDAASSSSQSSPFSRSISDPLASTGSRSTSYVANVPLRTNPSERLLPFVENLLLKGWPTVHLGFERVRFEVRKTWMKTRHRCFMNTSSFGAETSLAWSTARSKRSLTAMYGAAHIGPSAGSRRCPWGAHAELQQLLLSGAHDCLALGCIGGLNCLAVRIETRHEAIDQLAAHEVRAEGVKPLEHGHELGARRGSPVARLHRARSVRAVCVGVTPQHSNRGRGDDGDTSPHPSRARSGGGVTSLRPSRKWRRRPRSPLPRSRKRRGGSGRGASLPGSGSLPSRG